MALDVEAIKRRRNVMMVVCAIATIVAVGSMGLYLRGEHWALASFVAAVAAGFGAQMWFMAGIRGRKGDF